MASNFNIAPGIYAGGGGEFRVVGVGRHSEKSDDPNNVEDLVLYHGLDGSINKWMATPLKVFVSSFTFLRGHAGLEREAEIYEHYRTGSKYEFLGIGVHTETLEELVFYKALYDSPKWGLNALWVRPKEMFFENVENEGRIVPRFKYLGRNL